MLDICIMNAADIRLGMRLKEHAGWNQTEADWQRYLELQPDGCFVASLDGEAVGTLTTCVFGPVAWIAMVLVDVRYRRRGIGEALMRHALEFLDHQGVRTIRLDATALGQPLYEKLGFAVEYTLHRYEGVLLPADRPTGVEPALPDHLAEVLALDRTITQTDRRKLLLRLASEFPETLRVVCEAGRVEGFGAARPGARALQIGPCLAPEKAGRQLLEDARKQYFGRLVFMDVPVGNYAAVAGVEEAGLAVQRRLVRMCRGPALVEQVRALWASSGPEMG
jgi:ribosomal protein S18 acetylase RimI-like enzyme